MAKKANASEKENAPSKGAALNGNTGETRSQKSQFTAEETDDAEDFGDKEEKSRVSDEAIRIRAYLISEQRERVGIPGDANSDWIEARRQLLAELGES